MNFTGTTTIIIDGTPLPAFPPMFSIVSDYRLLFSLPPQSKLGPVDVVLKNAFGQTRCEVNIVPNAVPALELASSEPNFLIKALGMNVSISGNPDDITYVMMSTSLGSTTRAGLFDIPLAIGNSGTNLVMRGPFRIGDSGHLDMTIAIDQIPPGTTLHVQAANALLSNNYALPLSVSNHQTGTILF